MLKLSTACANACGQDTVVGIILRLRLFALVSFVVSFSFETRCKKDVIDASEGNGLGQGVILLPLDKIRHMSHARSSLNKES